MLPQAAHRRATLAARCAQPPLNAIGTWDGRSQRNRARRAGRERKRDPQPDRQPESVSLNSHRCNRGGSSASARRQRARLRRWWWGENSVPS